MSGRTEATISSNDNRAELGVIVKLSGSRDFPGQNWRKNRVRLRSISARRLAAAGSDRLNDSAVVLMRYSSGATRRRWMPPARPSVMNRPPRPTRIACPAVRQARIVLATFFEYPHVGGRHVLREAGHQVVQPIVGPLIYRLDGALFQMIFSRDFLDQLMIPGRPAARATGVEPLGQPLSQGNAARAGLAADGQEDPGQLFGRMPPFGIAIGVQRNVRAHRGRNDN